jgi:hypothetical protein
MLIDDKRKFGADSTRVGDDSALLVLDAGTIGEVRHRSRRGTGRTIADQRTPTTISLPEFRGPHSVAATPGIYGKTVSAWGVGDRRRRAGSRA